MGKIATKDVDGTQVLFNFVNGRRIIIDVATLPPEMVMQLAVHGMKQKGGDSYASADDKGMSVDDCADGVLAIIDNLQRGVFNAGGDRATGGIVAEALARITGQDSEKCRAVVKAMDPAQLKELRKRADVKAAMLAIQAERAKARVPDTVSGDTGDLFGLFE